MKTKHFLIGLCVLVTMIATGCSKNFFNRPPADEVSVGDFYQTTAQVQAGTAVLYSTPWFGMNGKSFLAIGDLQSGNAVCYAGTDGEFAAFANFSEGNATPAVQNTWNSLYTVVAQANSLLNNLNGVPASVPQSVVNDALGEARLIRATAYFYLVRNFGNVPIITNPLDIIDSFSTVPVNPVTDVYKFIISDLQYAMANCIPNQAQTGHASSGTAAGMLAKVYLYEQNYDSAAFYAEKVINSGEFSLVGTGVSQLSYNQLFESEGNNCPESMLAEQWTATGGYGYGNQIQSVTALNTTLTGTGDGWAELGPTFDLQNLFILDGDVIRRHGSIMIPGDVYPELLRSSGGFTVPLDADAQGTHAAMKKYVVGTAGDGNGGTAIKQTTTVNTVLLRFADMYLIAAEAILGKAAGVSQGTGIDTNYVCTDPTALSYINIIRARAGVGLYPSNFTYRQLLNERRLEFAGEGDFWYDLQRVDGFNSSKHPVAIALIAAQNRGQATAGTAANNYTDYTINNSYLTATNAQFLLPIPATETTMDPALLQPPVPYNFSNN